MNIRDVMQEVAVPDEREEHARIMLRQLDDCSVGSDLGFRVRIIDPHTVRYEEAWRSLDFEINIECCGGIQFVLHTFPPPDHWNRDNGEDRVPISEDEYHEIVKRVRASLEYLKLDFAVD